jgi:cell division protein FtsI (penicillin-binding protein 3)
MKRHLDAQEIIAAVMESQTGKVIAMASSERYDPANIKQKDVSALNPKFSEYPYEVGSVMKPVTLAVALDLNRVTPDTWFETFNGRMKIGKNQPITDDDPFPALTVTDIIVHSSNIGVSQISWKLTGDEFRTGLLKFGLSQPSGIDLSRDLPGKVKSLRLLRYKMHRANQSYGYGMHATFAQMLKAYSAFNNDGKAMTPRIIDYFENKKGKHYKLPPPQPDRDPISKKVANQVHQMLKEVDKRGTGVAAQYRGLEIGGKTGTAHIATSKGYKREYHSSFYGFANDNSGNKYTIGVLVIKPQKYRKYFASQSAVPTFKKITGTLVGLDYLKPELSAEELAEDEKKRVAKERKEALREAQRRAEEARKSKPPKPSIPKPVRKPRPEQDLFNDLDMF